jgi:type III secretion protein D
MIDDDVITRTQVLRILSGRLAGIEKALPDNGTLSIGHEYWQDIVIRDPAVKGIALDLTIDAAGIRITMLTGTASLLGSTLAAGETAILAPYVPFTIGGVAIAHGAADSARWTEAGGLAAAIPAPPALPPTLQDQAMTMVARSGEYASGLLVGWRLPALVGAGALLVAATAAGPAMDALGFMPDHAGKIERALDKAGLPELRATTNHATNAVIVAGVVTGEADRAKASEVLRTVSVPAQLDVQTSADLAQASADIARIRGLSARARPIGRTDVELHTSPLSPEARDQLVDAVKSDLHDVGRVVLHDDLPPQDGNDGPVRTVADATKKVSTVVAGDPAYIQTADGARYFAGAMMPSGHRLVAIEGQIVRLEKNGHEVKLSF